MENNPTEKKLSQQQKKIRVKNRWELASNYLELCLIISN